MAFSLEYLISDVKGRTSKTSLHVAEGFTLAQYTSFHTALIAAIRAIISGVVRTGQLCLDIDISSIDQTGKAALVSDVEEVGEFIFQADSGLKFVLNIPGWDETKTTAGSDAVTLGDTDVAAFLAAMADAVDVGGDSVAAMISARERFRNSGPRT